MEEPRRKAPREAGMSRMTPEGVSAASGDAPPNGSHPEDRVARCAYRRFEERGRQHGRDLDDWLEAEREVMLGEHQ